MYCMYCGKELEEGVTLCPACGKDNGGNPEAPENTAPVEEAAAAAEIPQPEEAPEAPKKKKKLWILAVAAVLVLALAAAVYYWYNGGSFTPRPNDLFYKESYSAQGEAAEKAADTVIATIGDKTLTNAQLQVYYWSQLYDFIGYYGDSIAYLGLDYTKPLDAQLMADGKQTWQQYFLEVSLNTWQRYQALGILAEEAGYTLPQEVQENIDSLPDKLEVNAKANGYESAAEMLRREMGDGCTVEDYVTYMALYCLGYEYFNDQFEAFEPTEQEIVSYYNDHAEEFASKGITKESDPYVDVRHILIMPQGGTLGEDGKTTTYSEEEWEACRAEAQALLDRYLAGEVTEEAFAQLAVDFSQDPGSKEGGGLYTDVTKGRMVAPFENWCFDDARKPGDTGLVQTNYGYHVMYFVESRDSWFVSARNELLSQRSKAMVEEAIAQYPMDVNYRKIVIGTASALYEEN